MVGEEKFSGLMVMISRSQVPYCATPLLREGSEFDPQLN